MSVLLATDTYWGKTPQLNSVSKEQVLTLQLQKNFGDSESCAEKEEHLRYSKKANSEKKLFNWSS